MNTILLLDHETTGTNPATDVVVETAGVLFSITHGTLVSGFSFVFKRDANPAEHINGIPAGVLREHGAPPDNAWQRVGAWIERADVVASHNASFDKSFTPGSLVSLRPWICTQEDVDWPRASSGQKLTDICLAHGVGVSKAHRALTDVMLMADLLERMALYDVFVTDLVARALRPKRRYRAVTQRYDPVMNEKIKAAGFRWDPDRKEWWRRLVVKELADLAASYPFPIAPADDA